MGVIGVILLVFFIISALLLIGIVLIQDEQGEGLGGLFGGGGAAPVGSRKGNLLTRITSVLGAIFVLASLGLAWVNRSPDAEDATAVARRLEAGEGGRLEWWIQDEDVESSDGEDEDDATGTPPDAATEGEPPASETADTSDDASE